MQKKAPNKLSDINKRLNRLIGQIEGIRKMIDSSRPCEETAQQIMAAREALTKVGILILKEGACSASTKNEKRIEEIFSKVFRV